METIKVNTSQHIEIDYPVAGLGERVAARLIDGVLFVVTFFFVAIVLSITGITDFGEVAFLIIIIIYGACYVFYDLLCEIFWNGQSVGKRFLKIKVISIDGAPPSMGQYFMRWIFRIVDFTLTGSLCGLICVAVSEKKQRVGDLVAGTTLIKTEPSTLFNHIAFHPAAEDYVPVFDNVHLLNDQDIELIHEVMNTYYKTLNKTLIYQMAEKVMKLLSIKLPDGMNELDFLKTVIADYKHLTSVYTP
jgi:uncharacterized RDD family membrane protein YckC